MEYIGGSDEGEVPSPCYLPFELAAFKARYACIRICVMYVCTYLPYVYMHIGTTKYETRQPTVCELYYVLQFCVRIRLTFPTSLILPSPNPTSYPILSNPILSYPILSNPILSSPILSPPYYYLALRTTSEFNPSGPGIASPCSRELGRIHSSLLPLFLPFFALGIYTIMHISSSSLLRSALPTIQLFW